jgi:hypothetical protein
MTHSRWRTVWYLIIWLSATTAIMFAAPVPRVASDDLRVEIVNIGGTDSGLFGATVKFTNSGTKPITLIKPRDGSEHCLIHPHYQFTIVGRDGKPLPFGDRCNFFGAPYSGTEWPKDYLLAVPGGKSVEVSVPIYGPMKPNTTYTVRFEYRFDPSADGTDANGLESHNVWRGSIASQVKMFAMTDTGIRTLAIGRKK